MFCGSFSLLLLTCRFTSALVKEEGGWVQKVAGAETGSFPHEEG